MTEFRITPTSSVRFDMHNKVMIIRTNLIAKDSEIQWVAIVDVMKLYSIAKEQFKLFANIDDDFPLNALTPSHFTVVNGWGLEIRGDTAKVQFNGFLNVNVPRVEPCKREHVPYHVQALRTLDCGGLSFKVRKKREV